MFDWLSKHEFRIAWLFGILSLLFINMQLIMGYVTVPDQLLFTGVGLNTQADMQTYTAWIKEGAAGQVWMRNLFSSEPQSAGLFHPLFLLLGQVSYWFDLQPITVYHGARVVLSAIFLCLLYRFLSRILENPAERLVAFFFIFN
jgi:hypothetical protein